MRKTIGLVLAVAIALMPFTGAFAEQKRFKGSFFDVFDTYSEIIVYTTDEAAAQEIIQFAHDELAEYHKLYDIYNSYDGLNNIKTVNEQAGIAPVEVDQRLIDLLVYAKEMDVETNGLMNIALGSVLQIWHAHRTEGINDPENATLPDMDELKAAAEHIDINNIVIDTAARTVYLTDTLTQLDVGSIAKGYAVERVAKDMIAKGTTSALLSIGGNVRSIGVRGDGTSWRVNVQNPDLSAANQGLTTLDLSNLSLVTSGSYQRYYTVDGKQYHHIIDPSTLMPSAYTWAVSIVTEDSGLGDALTTALFNMSIEDGKAFMKNFPQAEALWVTLDGQIERTDGFSALAKEETPAQ